MRYFIFLIAPILLASCSYQVATQKVGTVTDKCDLYMSSNDYTNIYTTVCRDDSKTKTRYREGKLQKEVETVDE